VSLTTGGLPKKPSDPISSNQESDALLGRRIWTAVAIFFTALFGMTDAATTGMPPGDFSEAVPTAPRHSEPSLSFEIRFWFRELKAKFGLH